MGWQHLGGSQLSDGSCCCGGFGCFLGLGGCNDACWGKKHGWVDCDAAVQQRANDLLDSGDLIQQWQHVSGVVFGCMLDFGASE
jgi:hypothetical protein